MKLTSSFVHEVKRIQVCQPFFLALALCLTTATALRAQLPNPTAYLTFDESAGTVAHDSSGNNNNATLFGAAGWTTGLVGPFALSLPGFPIGFPPGSYAEIPGDVLDTTKSYTVAAWWQRRTLDSFLFAPFTGSLLAFGHPHEVFGRLDIQLFSTLVADHARFFATLVADALIGRASDHLFDPRQIRRQLLATGMFARLLKGQLQLLALTFGFDLGATDSRLKLEQLQLAIGEFFAVLVRTSRCVPDAVFLPVHGPYTLRIGVDLGESRKNR